MTEKKLQSYFQDFEYKLYIVYNEHTASNQVLFLLIFFYLFIFFQHAVQKPDQIAAPTFIHELIYWWQIEINSDLSFLGICNW